MQWTGRLVLERLDHFSARFLTLTYADDPGILNPVDLSNWLKRYRYFHGAFRYFAVGEYGDRNGRGHWHCLVFGHPQEFIGHVPVFPSWDKGFVFDGDVSSRSIAYVAGYALKKLDKVKRNITRMSLRPGIGLDRLASFGAEAAAGPSLVTWPGAFHYDGKRYPLCEGGLRAFQNGYLDAGGLPPVSQTPDERHMVALDRLADLGTRIQSERDFNGQYVNRRYGVLASSPRERF